MRIAFVAQPFDVMHPPVRGGSLSMWIYYMAKLCAQRGHQPVVLANHGSKFSTQRTSADNVDYVFTPTFPDKVRNKLSNLSMKLMGAQKAAEAKRSEFGADSHHRGYALQAAKHLEKLECDVIHVMNYSQFVPVIRKRNPKARISLHMQCEWLTQLDPKVVRERLAQTDLVVGCSEYITRLIAGKFPEYANRCVTVPNAADVVPEATGSSLAEKVVLFVGRLSPEKGIHDLIRAFHDVLKQFPDAKLRIVGGAGSAPIEYMVGISDDPNVRALSVYYQRIGNGTRDIYLEILEKEAGDELGKRIIFEGRADHHQIEKFYQNAGVLVGASLSESFGIGLVEAMMHQVPVVATRTGGMTYTVEPGKTGLLVAPANPKELAGAICQIFADRDAAKRMGEAGRVRAIEKFSWEKTAELLLEKFQACLN